MSGTAHDTFGWDALQAELTVDEGRNLRLYVDSRGYASIGIGRNLTSNGITAAECEAMFQHDVDEAVADLDHFIPWWRTLPPARQRVMVNLTFNMGWPTLSTFRRFLARMEQQDWAGAAAELRASQWWHQVGERGPRMVARLVGD